MKLVALFVGDCQHHYFIFFSIASTWITVVLFLTSWKRQSSKVAVLWPMRPKLSLDGYYQITSKSGKLLFKMVLNP